MVVCFTDNLVSLTNAVEDFGKGGEFIEVQDLAVFQAVHPSPHHGVIDGLNAIAFEIHRPTEVISLLSFSFLPFQ